MSNHQRFIRRFSIILALFAAWAAAAGWMLTGVLAADEPLPAKIDFNKDIRPILNQHCLACHGFDAAARKADLRLDDFAVAVAKKAIVPGNPQASLLVARIESASDDERMPPAEFKKPLTQRQKSLLRAWIAQGAVQTRHWSFIPPVQTPPPAVQNRDWPNGPLDRFIAKRLEQEHLRPSPPAEPAALLRRLSLDLTGLPPKLHELEEFLADQSPDAVERAIDRLIVSPAYAERMTLAWLDAARYADTNGFNNDEDRTQWPWRDWAIDAFARNMPFDQFIVDQLAGDLLPGAGMPQQVASGFHRNQVHNTEGGIIPEEYRVEYVADRVHTTATVFLGLSLQCARCHDHKYDPITQKDYYAFFAFFNNASDKQANYSNFVAAEPFVRAPTAAQREKQTALAAQKVDREKSLQQIAANSAATIAQWEKTLSPQDKERLSSVGLAMRLPLDETTGDAVASADGAKRGIVKGKPNWISGKFGGALQFDGQTHLEISDPPIAASDAPFSISVWVRPTGGGAIAIASKMDDAAAYRGWDLLLEEGRVVMHLVNRWPEDAIKVHVKKAIPKNEWRHIAVAYDGSRQAAGLRIYLDGQPEPFDVTSDSLKGTIATDKPMHLGRRQSSLFFQGAIDEFQFYKLPLTAEQITKLACGQAAPLAAEIMAIPMEKRTAAQQAQIGDYYLENIHPQYPALRKEIVELARQAQELEKSFPAVMVMQDLPQPRETFVLKRGQYDQPGEKTAAYAPPAISPLPPGAPPNRLGLAQWLVDRSHPLTARVAVNRWWQMLYGVGLVKTVEDFGATGEPPSHPELLDYLAVELIRHDWDLKTTLRKMVGSATYRQASRMTPASFARDPENRLLARGPRQRLPAELVRDNALAVSGLLVERLGGPSVKPYQPAGLWEDVSVERRSKYVAEQGSNLYRRGLYTFWKRTCPPPGLSAFDAPNREVCVARRAITNTPLQALVLLNDPTYVEAARYWAAELLTTPHLTPAARIDRALQAALSRPADATEKRVLLELLAKAHERFKANPAAARQLLSTGDAPQRPGLDEAELAAWTMLGSLILNLDETISKR